MRKPSPKYSRGRAVINDAVYKIMSAVCIVLMLPLVIPAFVLVLILVAVKMIWQNNAENDPDFFV